MLRRRKARFVGKGDGVDVRLDEREREYLRWLVPQLRSMLVGGAAGEDVHEGLRRLFPTAHPNDVEAEEEYRSMMRDELLAGRLSALDEVEGSLDATHLDEDLTNRWMTVVNDLRLVIGTLLDVGEDDPPVIDEDDPDAPSWFAYSYLSGLLGELLEARGHG